MRQFPPSDHNPLRHQWTPRWIRSTARSSIAAQEKKKEKEQDR
jgi:hypothetical protein